MKIDDVRWVGLHSVRDVRGALTAIEEMRDIPFEIKRVFYMHDVVSGADRGGHAHPDTDQLAVAVHGSLRISVCDGRDARVVTLDDPTWGIYLPRMTWTRLTDFSAGAVCVVLASTHYDMSRSIRTWEAYLVARGIPYGPEPMNAKGLRRPDPGRPHG